MPKCAYVQFTMENADDRSCCVHQDHEVTLLQSGLIFKDHGDHQETHENEELTTGVVLKHVVAVTTVVLQLDVKAEQREEIVVDTVAKTWRREILSGTKFWLSVLCLYQCSVGRSLDFSREAAETPSFHSLGPVSQDVDRHSGWCVGS